MSCPTSISTFIAINLLSYHSLILKLCVILQFIPYLLQSTWHPIICEFSNLASSCISFHIHCNRLAILSFSILKICVVLQFIPHLLQSTLHLIICEFSNCASSCTYSHSHCNRLAILSFSDFQIVRLPASLSTFIAIDLLSYYFLI